MRFRLLSCCPALGLLLVAGGVHAADPAPSAAPATAEVERDAPMSDAEAQFHVMAGEMAAARHQPLIAAREFLAALQAVDDAGLAQRATGLALAGRDENLALAAALRWLQLEPNAMDAREVIARVALSRGDLTTASQQCQAIIEGHAGGIDEGFRIAAGILSQADMAHGDAALSVIRELAGRYPKNVGAAHAVALVALRFNQLDVAESASLQALALAPKSRDEKLLRVGVLVKRGKIDGANAVIDTLVKKEEKADELRLAYAKLLLESNQREPARTQLQKILAHTPNQPDAMFALGVMAANDQDVDTAERYFTALLDGDRGEDAALQLGRLHESRGDYAGALDYYGRVQHGAQALDAATRQSGVLAKMGRLDDARRLLAQLRDRFPQFAIRFTLAESELLLNAQRYDDALTLLDGAVQDAPDNVDLLYSRSLVYERLGKIDAAEKDLRAALAADPDDARSLNALGYMLAVHTQRLDEAHDLVGRALTLDPDDAAIIDSMGWVEFKRGNTELASQLLKRAFAEFPDPEVAAHLGEVLWTLGRKDEARSVWNKALRDSPEHPVLKETVQRLTK
ncbi:tetratricopeptide repeat protein [Solimonas flava]|uniref:tetratricopeptide repeat protein n=1 Tax=Solimonas flava TaxID=415849 RepID=UPI00040AB27B|nr:tetratricopeptide repeat protein [Solimonas flava]